VILVEDRRTGKHLFRYVYIDGLALKALRWLELAERWSANIRVSGYARNKQAPLTMATYVANQVSAVAV
jgi:hypothetical protein